MKVEIVNVETIKPSSPTPLDLKTYTLSAFDQVAFPIYSSVVLVYRPSATNVAGIGYDQFSQTLKNSLSDTLTLFPPLAGKIKDNVSVDCNDHGVPCYESRVHSTLDQLLLLHDLECLKHLVVVGDEVNVDTGAQVLVQINQFDCGGIAIGVSFSHYLCDAATFTTFLKSWSAKAINSSQVTAPHFTVSTDLPPRKDFIRPNDIKSPPRHDLISARLVFNGKKIDALKAKSASPTSTPQPTRLEAVTALISKCAMVAFKANNESYSMPFVSVHAVNIRKKFVPSLPETAFGNVLGGYEVISEQSDVESLDILVDKLRKRRMEYSDSLALMSTGKKMIDEHLQYLERVKVMFHGGALEIYIITSWCRFGFYEIDFGFGKPIWVGPVHNTWKNMVYFLDAKDGNGIEAHVTFTKQDMALFQADPLLLQYASVNPPA